MIGTILCVLGTAVAMQAVTHPAEVGTINRKTTPDDAVYTCGWIGLCSTPDARDQSCNPQAAGEPIDRPSRAVL